ncbi:hypothetical protein CRE_28369 [Caenorhabditis remanei]|uniref:Uncharacterized protein n=1 Tax=Caenorhabditis remanei TaxID=31234 RepID=E3LLZ4_CAERE|nr:hypothetical protein CRE_28369 [Caenorhabditis remanei]
MRRMVECNISKCTKILLIVQLFLIIVEGESKIMDPKFKISIITAQTNASPTVDPIKVTGKQKFAFDREKVVNFAITYRFNTLIVGGVFNMILSLINLILGLVNFYFLFGRYDSRLRQVAAKLKIAVEEMTSRDLHPKVKMCLSRSIPPNNPMLGEIMKLFKEPSKLFDNANGLLSDQKETRLRKMNVKKEKEENTAKSPAPKSQQPSSAISNPRSVPTNTKKEK